MKTFLFYRTPDYGKALTAAKRVFDLFTRKPLIDNESKDGDEIVSQQQQYFYSIILLL
jgi:ABC-type multidrug transport system fused ATPase/permease subunit